MLSDFAFCLRVCSADAAICFHDDQVIAGAIKRILADLARDGVEFTARKFPGVTFGIFLRNCPASRDPYVVKQGHDGEQWIRRQKFRDATPSWLRPAARWVANRLRF